MKRINLVNTLMDFPTDLQRELYKEFDYNKKVELAAKIKEKYQKSLEWKKRVMPFERVEKMDYTYALLTGGHLF